MNWFEGAYISKIPQITPLDEAIIHAVDLAAYKEGFPDANALLRSDENLAEPYIDAARARFLDKSTDAEQEG